MYWLFRTRGITGSLSKVLNRVIPSTKTLDHTIINNDTYFITKTLKTSLKQANILKFCLKHFVDFGELEGALRCLGELGGA